MYVVGPIHERYDRKSLTKQVYDDWPTWRTTGRPVELRFSVTNDVEDAMVRHYTAVEGRKELWMAEMQKCRVDVSCMEFLKGHQ